MPIIGFLVGLIFFVVVVLALFFLLAPIGGAWSIIFGAWIVIGLHKALTSPNKH